MITDDDWKKIAKGDKCLEVLFVKYAHRVLF